MNILSSRLRRALPISLVALALAACPDDDGTPTDTTTAATDTQVAPDADAATADAEDDDADATTIPSTVRVFRAETDADLPGGPVVLAEPGAAWVLENDVARWVIQDVGASAGYHLYGGNPVGGALRGGESVLREAIAVVDYRVVEPTSVAIVADGSDGERAILRFTGELAVSKIIDILDGLAGTHPYDVAIEYEIRRDSPELLMRTIVTNAGDAIAAPIIGDFIVFGNQLQIVASARGFGGDGGVGAADWLAARGEGASYGYYRDGDPLSVPYVANSGTVALLDDGTPLAIGGTATFERSFVVGDGTLQSVLAPIYAAQEAPTGTVRGTVTDGDDAPAAGVWVTALPVPASGGTPTRALNQARTAADGSFALTLPPGSYDVIASGGERRPSAPSRVEVAAAAEVTADLTVEDTVALRIVATGDGMVPTSSGTLPIQVALRPAAGTEDVVDARLGDWPRVGGWRLEWVGPGHEVLQVPPGSWEIVVSRGPEYDRVALGAVDVDEDTTLPVTLTRTVATDGWLGCDFHQHTIGSLDARTGFEERVRENLAAALPCFATTEHDHVVDLAPHIASAGAQDALFNVIGDEISVNGVGHFQAYPMPLDEAAPLALSGVQLWVDLSIAGLFERLRALAGEHVLQINHPRSDGLKGYFTNLRLDPVTFASRTSRAAAEDFDALEVNADLGQPADFTVEGWRALRDGNPERVPVLMDWFGLLNLGHTVAGVGNSDCHDPGSDCGYPRTYLDVGAAHATAATATDAAVVEALKAQRAVVARGVWLSVTTNGQAALGHLEPVDGALGVEIEVTAQVPAWLSVSRVELYENGLHVASWTPSGDDVGARSVVATFSRTPGIDSWYVVVARGAGDPAPVFRGAPFGFTNPVYVDVDGEGFTAPGPVLLD